MPKKYILLSLIFALKGNNSCKTYNFRIKVGNVHVVYYGCIIRVIIYIGKHWMYHIHQTTGKKNKNDAGIVYSSIVPEFTCYFQQDSCCSIVSFLLNVLQIVVCPVVPFLLAIPLSVILRFTYSDYPFVIFKLFFDSLK